MILTILAILILVFALLLSIGIFRPAFVLPFMKQKTRAIVLLIYGSIIIILLATISGLTDEINNFFLAFFLYLLTWSCVISFVLMLIGLIKPALVIRFSENKSRSKVLVLYGSVFVATLIGLGIGFNGFTPTLPAEDIEKCINLKKEIDADINKVISDFSYYDENLSKFADHAKWVDVNISPFIDKYGDKVNKVIKVAKYSPEPTMSEFAKQFEFILLKLKNMKQLNYSIAHMKESASVIRERYNKDKNIKKISTLREISKEISANYTNHLKNVSEFSITIASLLNKADELVSKVIDASEYLSDKYKYFTNNVETSKDKDEGLINRIKNYKSNFMGAINKFNNKTNNNISICNAITANIETFDRMHKKIVNHYTDRIKKEPNNSQLFYDRGVFLIRTVNYQEGIVDLKKSAKMGNINAQKMLTSVSENTVLKSLLSQR